MYIHDEDGSLGFTSATLGLAPDFSRSQTTSLSCNSRISDVGKDLPAELRSQDNAGMAGRRRVSQPDSGIFDVSSR